MPENNDLEHKRSAVRRIVTFGMLGVYAAAVGYMLVSLMEIPEPNVDAALGVLGMVAAIATGIIGFWFGSRQPK